MHCWASGVQTDHDLPATVPALCPEGSEGVVYVHRFLRYFASSLVLMRGGVIVFQ